MNKTTLKKISDLLREEKIESDKIQKIENVIKQHFCDYSIHSTEYILNWLKNKRKNSTIEVNEIPLHNVKHWITDPNTGNIYHEKGRFFSIIGLRITGASNREISSWTQPIVKQHECGILGFLCKEFNGSLHYLFRAKFDPGNIEKIHLAPTLQATQSNLEKAHGGNLPPFANYFLHSDANTVFSQIAVEDGGRFYLKTSRLTVVKIDEDIMIPDDFIWISSSQIHELLDEDCIINVPARAVLGSL